ncbi:MAG TPA: hypothetical protein VLT33_37430 [Labilithrix sp.]|nr:hypothetical protein [Labilithrix sp.]
MKNIALVALAAAAVLLTSSAARADERAEASATARAPNEPADRPSSKRESSDDDRDAFRIGVLGGIGFPRPLALEGLVKIDRVVGLGVEYSLLPKTTFGSVETSFWAIAADARVFPFRNGFFIGMRAGRQVLSASASFSAGALGTLTESARAETWFLNPRLGFLWTWRSGFTVGIDAGVQIPLSNARTSTIPEGLPVDISGTIASVQETLGTGVTPTVDLLRVGFLF